MRNRTEMLHLVAQVALAGLDHAALSPEDRADFYEGLSALLPRMESESAKYLATCLRECQRAQRDFLSALETRKGGA